MQYAFYYDPSRCIQCLACEVACKAEHDLAPRVDEKPGGVGPRWRQVITVQDAMREDAPQEHVSMACMHCGSPTCLAACPTHAIYREPQFGIVLVDRKRCIGCRYCSWACEFGAPQFGRDGLMQKCDLCIDRLKAGEQPACVASCCGGAIKAGPIEELEVEVRRRVANRLVAAAKPQLIMVAGR